MELDRGSIVGIMNIVNLNVKHGGRLAWWLVREEIGNEARSWMAQVLDPVSVPHEEKGKNHQEVQPLGDVLPELALRVFRVGQNPIIQVRV